MDINLNKAKLVMLNMSLLMLNYLLIFAVIINRIFRKIMNNVFLIYTEIKKMPTLIH